MVCYREAIEAVVRPGDIVVDDMDLDVPTKVYRPNEWVYESA